MINRVYFATFFATIFYKKLEISLSCRLWQNNEYMPNNIR